MKKRELKKLAAMGLAGGLLLSMQSQAFAQGWWGQSEERSPYNQQDQGQNQDAMQRNMMQRDMMRDRCSGNTQCPGMQPGNQQGQQGYMQGQQQGQQGYMQGQQQGYMQGQQPGQQMSEAQLLSQLGREGRALYQSLSPRGKALALRLASQTEMNAGPNSDKTEAIKAAVRYMNEQRGQGQGATSMRDDGMYKTRDNDGSSDNDNTKNDKNSNDQNGSSRYRRGY